MMPTDAWTLRALEVELEQFEQELRAAGKEEATVHTYVDRTARFLRWLAGEYDPKAQ
jgi:hypothetical protein